MTEEQERRPADLDAAISRGIDDADTGRTTPAAQVFDWLQSKYAAMTLVEGDKPD